MRCTSRRHFTCVIIMKMLISLCLNGWVSNGYELSESACEESLKTLETVYKCPSNKTQYDTAERRKNCSRYNQTTCKSFQYHCAFNENMTGLVEVCTTSRYILSGRCAEFNTGYKTIRDSYSTNCTGFDPPCPLYYNSTETYKYPDCYRMFEVENNTFGTASKTYETNEVDIDLTAQIVLTISTAIVMITILIVSVWFKVYRVPKENSNTSNADTEVSKENSNMSIADTGMSKENSNMSNADTGMSKENSNMSIADTGMSKENSNMSVADT